MSCTDDRIVRGWLLLVLLIFCFCVIIVPVKLTKKYKNDSDQMHPAGPSCFVLNTEHRSWYAHNRNALAQRCQMAAIRYPVENEILLFLIEQQPNVSKEDDSAIWLGGKLHGKLGHPGPQNWGWSDGKSKWTYENWSPGEPNNFWEEFYTEKETVEDRITFRFVNGKRAWNDLRQMETIPALYKCCRNKNSNNTVIAKTVSNDECHYKLNPADANWTEHQAFAQSKGCEMASILNAEENKMAIEFIENSEISHVDSIWLGGQLIGIPAAKGPKHWKWSDNSPYSFEDWLEGEPNDFWLSEEDSLSMRYYADRDEWRWNDLLATVEIPAFYNCCQE